jgi:UDP-N-acetylmuramoyl-L-alanyl-D-glutamate--2,6-diaminopimelate ligase/murE/murF fusion protein
VKLSELVKDLGAAETAGNKNKTKDSGSGTALSGLFYDPDIKSVHYRAQDVGRSGLFVAIKGHSADGHDFIDEAMARGASAVIVQKPVNKDYTAVRVENTRKALGKIAARFYGNPSMKLVLIGITGTNGKTTTSYLIESILASAGYKVGLIGTVNYRYSGKTFSNPVTTPESLDLQRILSEMSNDGITHVVMEVSSHALDLFRVEACFFDAAVFTNLTHDHLDYHRDMETYWSCKKKLFTEMLVSGPKSKKAFAVINCDDARGRELSEILAARCIKTGSKPGYDVHPVNSGISPEGIEATISTSNGSFHFKSNLVGKHNIDNIMSAAGVCTGLSIPPGTTAEGIESVRVIPGRLERIDNAFKRSVYVDYAHTPDALENVLLSLRPVTDGRLICIFGCGGDRDRKKRPVMGKIAASLSDIAVITSDNPRTEEPLGIIKEITEGVKLEKIRRYNTTELKSVLNGRGYVTEPDRRKAICLGISISKPGDTVLIAGKGHENYQITGVTKNHFDDREEARIALSSINSEV